MSDPLITSGAMYSMVPTPVLLQRLPPGVGTIEYMAPERSEEHTSELQSRSDLVCRLLLEKKKPASRSETRSRSDPSGAVSADRRPRDEARRLGAGVTSLRAATALADTSVSLRPGAFRASS